MAEDIQIKMGSPYEKIGQLVLQVDALVSEIERLVQENEELKYRLNKIGQKRTKQNRVSNSRLNKHFVK